GAAQSSGGADTFFNWFAEGVLVGPNSLPVLKARAEAQNPEIANPSLGIGSTSATADAQGLQEYHYAGTTDGTYTISFHVDGLVVGDDESINAGLTIFNSSYVPELEGEFQHTFIAGGQLGESASTTNGAFSQLQEVTFTVTPGQDFFVLAFLSGNAFFSDCCSEDGVADASHTFTADFTAGDTSLLSTVPEPGLGLLVLLALGAVVLHRRWSFGRMTNSLYPVAVGVQDESCEIVGMVFDPETRLTVASTTEEKPSRV